MMTILTLQSGHKEHNGLWEMNRRGAREMAQLVKYLMCKHEDQSSYLQYPCKKPGTGAHVSNHWDGEMGGTMRLAELVRAKF